MIRTGARRDRVPAAFEPVVAEAVAAVEAAPVHGPAASLYLYGSVATGLARLGQSDVDLLSIDLADAGAIARGLSTRHADICRAVEIVAASATDLDGQSDAAHGFRVFLRHYCVILTGPDPSSGLPSYSADARAARGFNGDLAQHLVRWRLHLARAWTAGPAPSATGELGVRVARKSLLAVAGLVSMHDRTWTTDRTLAARRWGAVEPGLAPELETLLAWADREAAPGADDVARVLDDGGVVSAIVDRFAEQIGLWPEITA